MICLFANVFGIQTFLIAKVFIEIVLVREIIMIDKF